MSDGVQQAILGGGCFWCLEAVYQQVKGVERVVSGYAGGHVPNPDYETVCAETTGHAEVVQLQFDPRIVSYRQILEIFFVIHDPTTLNYQGNDVGARYRNAFEADKLYETVRGHVAVGYALTKQDSIAVRWSRSSGDEEKDAVRLQYTRSF